MVSKYLAVRKIIRITLWVSIECCLALWIIGITKSRKICFRIDVFDVGRIWFFYCEPIKRFDFIVFTSANFVCFILFCFVLFCCYVFCCVLLCFVCLFVCFSFVLFFLSSFFVNRWSRLTCCFLKILQWWTRSWLKNGYG